MHRPVLVLAVLAALAVPALAQAPAWGSDELDGGLGPHWTVREPVAGASSFTFKPGALTIIAQPGRLEGAENDPRHLPTQPAPEGDLRITTRVAFASPGPGAEAGLVLMVDDDHHATFALANSSGSRDLRLRVESAGATLHEVRVPVTDVTLWLRAERTGSFIRAYWSHDGVIWTLAGVGVLDTTNARMGLFATKGPTASPAEGAAPASFDFFRVEAPPADDTVTAPPDVILTAEPASGVAPVDVTFTIDLTYPYPSANWTFHAGDGTEPQRGTGLPARVAHRYERAAAFNATATAASAFTFFPGGFERVDVSDPARATVGGAESAPTGGTGTASTGGDAAPAGGTPPPGRADEFGTRATPRIVVARANDDFAASVAQGEMTLRAYDLGDPAGARFVAIDESGGEHPIADGASRASWNTTALANGWYTVEIRRARADGTEVAVASTVVLVENARASPAAVAGAAVVGVAVAGGTAALASRGFTLFGLLEEAGVAFGEERLRERTSDRMRVRLRTALAVAATLVLLVAFFAYAELSGWDLAAYLRAVGVVGSAAAAYIALRYGLEYALTRASGGAPEYKFWTPGALSLAVSSLVFRSPFGYPGYVASRDDEPTPASRRVAALRELALQGGGVATAFLFLLAGRALPYEFAEAGAFLALTTVAVTALPFRPFGGHAVWAWKRWVAVLVAAAGIALYYAHQVAALPFAALAVLGVLGAAGIALAIARLRPARQGL